MKKYRFKSCDALNLTYSCFKRNYYFYSEGVWVGGGKIFTPVTVTWESDSGLSQHRVTLIRKREGWRKAYI